MFNPIQVVIDAFVRQLQEQYGQVYGALEPGYPGVIEFIKFVQTIEERLEPR